MYCMYVLYIGFIYIVYYRIIMYSQRDVADHGVIVPQRLSRIFMVKIYCPIDGKFDIVRHVDYMPCDFNAVVVIYIVFLQMAAT